MITKVRFFGLLAVLILGFLIFRAGEEPSNSGDRGDRPESATGRQSQPREPSFLAPRPDYGIAGSTRRADTPSPYGRDTLPRGPYSDGYTDQAGTYAPYTPEDRFATQGYHFRPLTEREQQRQRAQSSYPGKYADRYRAPYDEAAPYYPSDEVWEGSSALAPYSEPRPYAKSQRDAYNFRPLEQSPAAQSRWQGPYPEPGQRFDPYSTDPWMSPPPPQWGSTPPAQRMYPSFNRDSGYRLTAR